MKHILAIIAALMLLSVPALAHKTNYKHKHVILKNGHHAIIRDYHKASLDLGAYGQLHGRHGGWHGGVHHGWHGGVHHNWHGGWHGGGWHGVGPAWRGGGGWVGPRVGPCWQQVPPLIGPWVWTC